MFKNHPSNSCNWSFRRFWVFCAEELGSARLQVNANAQTLEQFCGNEHFALAPLKAALRASYKRSRCKNLDSPISLDALLDILGEAAHALHGQHKDDLLDIELLEEVGWCVNALYQKDSQFSTDIGATTDSLHSPRAISQARAHSQLVSDALQSPAQSLQTSVANDRLGKRNKNAIKIGSGSVVSLARAKQRRANSAG